METRARSSYPDSPHLGYGHPSDWITKPYSIVFIAVVFFILIFGIAIFLGYRQFETTRHNALTADKTTANLLADLIQEHNKATIGILQSYAYRPLFIAAVKNKNLAGAYRHLSDLKKNAEIDMTFVTDKRGILWTNFPFFLESRGKDLSYRDWYKGVSSHWKPDISTVFKLIVGDKPLAVAVCVPIFDEKGRPIGILGDTKRLSFLDAAIERVPFTPFTTVNVIDRTGHILYSNKFPYQESITDYRFFPILEPAVMEKKQQIEINDPQKDQEKRYLTVVPVGDIGWTVIIERSLRDIYRSDIRRFIEIGAVSFLLFLLIIFFLIYLRKANLFRKTGELLQAETKLQQSEESERETRDYLEKLIGYANAPIIVWDPQFRITRFNQAFEDLTGLKFEEVLEKEIDLLFPEDSLEECLGHIRQATGGERWEVIEIPILHRDGSVRTVLWNSATIYSLDGKTAIATIAQGQDITERKQAEEALRHQNEMLRTILDSIPVMVAFFDREGHHQLVNRCWQSTLGWSLEEAQYKDVLAEVYPDPAYRKYVMDYIAAAAGTWSDFKTRTRDGRVLDTSWVNVPLLDGSNIGIGIDITSRKQAEEALRESEENFRRSLDDSPLGVRIVTEEGETVYANRAILDIYGYDSIEELNTTPIKKRYTPESYAEFKIRREKRKRGDYNPSEYDINIVRKDGEVHHLQVFRKEVLWDGERQFQVVYQDITERKQAEEELRTSRLQLRALATRLQNIREEERLVIAREIHDVMGGGLTGLKIEISRLLRKRGDADQGEKRVALKDRIHTLNALIDQMIHVVRRISADLRPSVLDDLGLIAALEWQLSEFTSRIGIPHEFATTFEYVNMEENIAVAVFRIFQEALTNVVRHSRATKVAVVLREGERSLFGDESLVLEIRDNGRGITEEEILDPESLGLLGMKERVLSFGGELSIRGEPGGGTALVLKIPRKQGEAS